MRSAVFMMLLPEPRPSRLRIDHPSNTCIHNTLPTYLYQWKGVIVVKSRQSLEFHTNHAPRPPLVRGIVERMQKQDVKLFHDVVVAEFRVKICIHSRPTHDGFGTIYYYSVLVCGSPGADVRSTGRTISTVQPDRYLFPFLDLLPWFNASY